MNTFYIAANHTRKFLVSNIITALEQKLEGYESPVCAFNWTEEDITAIDHFKLSNLIKMGIRHAEAFICIYPKNNTNQYLEIGYALALEKPILLIHEFSDGIEDSIFFKGEILRHVHVENNENAFASIVTEIDKFLLTEEHKEPEANLKKLDIILEAANKQEERTPQDLAISLIQDRAKSETLPNTWVEGIGNIELDLFSLKNELQQAYEHTIKNTLVDLGASALNFLAYMVDEACVKK